MNRKIVLLALVLLSIAIGIRAIPYLKKDNYKINYQYVNIKNIAMATSTFKKEDSSQTILEKIDEWYLNEEKIEKRKIEFVSVDFPVMKNHQKNETVQNTIQWMLPTEMGAISQYPSYKHPAYDITSPRGSREIIYPVMNGVISNLYKDNAGGLTITILHTIDGGKYTSKYVHMWRYADGLYIGKNVSTSDPLGWMGATGYATGIHLHLEVYDCALFDKEDGNCYDYNHSTRYAKNRFLEGYRGLASHISVPYRWNHRDGSL